MQEMDVFLSVGPNCRAISYLRDFALTRFAAPTDWFAFKDLDTLLHLYQTHFSDFLSEIEEVESKSEKEFRFVRDTRYHVKSIHQFEKKLPLRVGQAYVQNKTILRAQKTEQALKGANSVGLLGSWEVPREELVRFLKGFSALYPGKKMVLYNIHHVPGETRHWKTETVISPLLSVEEFFFCDEGDMSSPDFWKGNQLLWAQILGQFRLSAEGRKRRDEACQKR